MFDFDFVYALMFSMFGMIIFAFLVIDNSHIPTEDEINDLV